MLDHVIPFSLIRHGALDRPKILKGHSAQISLTTRTDNTPHALLRGRHKVAVSAKFPQSEFKYNPDIIG